MKPGGLLLVEENDRFYSMAILAMYKHVLYEGDESRGAFSFHIGYDSVRGVVKRLLLNPPYR